MLNKQHTKRWLRWGFVKKHRWGFSGLETALVLLTWRGKALEWLLCNMLMVWVSTSQTLHDNCHQSTTCWLFPQSSPGMNESWKLNSPVPRLPLRAIPRRCLGNRRGKLALLFFFFSRCETLIKQSSFCFHPCQGSVCHECHLNTFALKEQSQVELGTLLHVNNWFYAASGQQKMHCICK